MSPRILLAVFLLATPCIADDYDSPPLKFIYEQYDEAVIQHYQREGQDWITSRIHFCRKGKVIADRYYDQANFRITVKPNNKINIEFEDYSTYQRSIDVDVLAEGPGVIEDDTNQWFFMGRRMTDLRVD